MFEIFGSLAAIWLALLKTREHFIKHPLKRRSRTRD